MLTRKTAPDGALLLAETKKGEGDGEQGRRRGEGVLGQEEGEKDREWSLLLLDAAWAWWLLLLFHYFYMLLAFSFICCCLFVSNPNKLLIQNLLNCVGSFE